MQPVLAIFVLLPLLLQKLDDRLSKSIGAHSIFFGLHLLLEELLFEFLALSPRGLELLLEASSTFGKVAEEELWPTAKRADPGKAPPSEPLAVSSLSTSTS
eukprot:CAMPEP_0197667928 /NCGR_PEP_ID=MMETSP1338-20131121/67850_1 /TAXON_ID=43686 ORGANISM="Pelagodinium beii, Strain RCC1491" /NCGR_SAMPLE_ID=MMETSP1338 /ASSEMBLY_ACC=CAM_ASM_000754 /LENGTH=100 /DNA_ID=CAMNT_0043247269 /DNA_START=201 /DNA_END=504 /DNA_ORIENTATION=+